MSCPSCNPCSATADLSVCASRQLRRCSDMRVFMDLLVVPMYDEPQLQGILYTPAALRGSRLSLAVVWVCLILVVGVYIGWMLFFSSSFPILSVTCLMYGKNALPVYFWLSVLLVIVVFFLVALMMSECEYPFLSSAWVRCCFSDFRCDSSEMRSALVKSVFISLFFCPGWWMEFLFNISPYVLVLCKLGSPAILRFLLHRELNFMVYGI